MNKTHKTQDLSMYRISGRFGVNGTGESNTINNMADLLSPLACHWRFKEERQVNICGNQGDHVGAYDDAEKAKDRIGSTFVLGRGK